MKICSCCKENKGLSEFGRDKGRKDGLYVYCKQCSKIKRKRLRDNNIDAIRKRDREYQKVWGKNNQNKKKKYFQNWRNKNLEKDRQRVKDWQKQNPNYFKNYANSRYKNDISYRIANRLRGRLWDALRGGSHKMGSAVKDLGCSLKELIVHLEQQFQAGMTWDNYGKWHIDHVIPLSSFNLENRDELLKACNYTNLQPLWAAENISKGGRTK